MNKPSLLADSASFPGGGVGKPLLLVASALHDSRVSPCLTSAVQLALEACCSVAMCTCN